MTTYKRVETLEELAIARTLHKEIFEGEGYLVEDIHPKSIQYLLYNGNEPVGVMEFTRYERNGFTTVKEFPFGDLAVVRENEGSVWEVDKVGLTKNARKNGHFGAVPLCMEGFAAEQEVTYYISLLDELLFRMLRMAYRQYKIEAVGKRFVVPGEKRKTVPVTIDVREFRNEEQKQLQEDIKEFAIEN